MKVTVDIENEQFDELMVEDLTNCYKYSNNEEDLQMAEAVKILLKRYYLSPSDWLKWEKANVK